MGSESREPGGAETRSLRTICDGYGFHADQLVPIAEPREARGVRQGFDEVEQEIHVVESRAVGGADAILPQRNEANVRKFLCFGGGQHTSQARVGSFGKCDLDGSNGCGLHDFQEAGPVEAPLPIAGPKVPKSTGCAMAKGGGWGVPIF